MPNTPFRPEDRKMIRAVLLVTACCLSLEPAYAGPLKIDRGIGKEPAYRTKTPKYGLVVFGPDGKDRVWLVLDGDTLYIDRNGNGDLTDPAKKVAPTKKPHRDPVEDGYTFEVGDVTVGGRTHKGLTVYFIPLKLYADRKRPDVKAALAKDSKALAVRLTVDAQVTGMKGGGIGGRIVFMAGPMDLTGVFQLADKPTNAPGVHFGGPLQITFYSELPSLRVGRATELDLVVGTPGVGPGTFAMLGYQDTIPENAKPVAEIAFPRVRASAARLKERLVIRDRC
jgi:hypothetical protein